MTVINTGLTIPGLKADFFQRYNDVVKHTYFEQLSTRIKSNTKKETYAFLGSVPPMREWGDGRLARGMSTESYDITNLKYENTLEIDRDEIDDDQTGQIRIRVSELADRAATHKDSLIAQLLINGATAGFNSYDGVSYFNAAHVSGKSGSQSNVLSLSGTVDPDDPTTAEFSKALKTAISTMLGLVDDQGEPMVLSLDSGLFVVVPPTMMWTALESINSTLVSSTTNVLQGAARVITFPYITATDTFYLLYTGSTVRPFIFQSRDEVEFTALENESDEGFRREKYLYGVRARYRMTYGYWQHAIQLQFTS